MKRLIALLLLLCLCLTAAGCAGNPEGASSISSSSEASSAPESSEEESEAESSEPEPEIPSEPEATPWPEKAMFYDDFTASTTLMERGWGANRDVKDGQLQLFDVSAYLTRYAPALNWIDYTVETTLTVLEGEYITNSTVIALVCRTVNTNSGYELGLVMSKDGSANLRLYNRTAAKEVGRFMSFKPKPDETYRLKMVCSGKRILCFVNDKLYFDYTDDSDKPNVSGSVGIRVTGGYDATVQEILVRPIDPSDLTAQLQTDS